MVSDQKTYDLMKKHVTSPDYGYKCEFIPVASQHVKQHTVKSGEQEPTFSQVSLNMFLHEWQVIQVLYKFLFCEKKCMLVATNKHLQLVVLSLFHKIGRQTNFSTVKPVLSGHPRECCSVRLIQVSIDNVIRDVKCHSNEQ